MALLGYKKQFVKPIKLGLKEWTIRNDRKNPIAVGERLYMYTGLRTRNCKKIGEAICTWTSRIELREDLVLIHSFGSAVCPTFAAFGDIENHPHCINTLNHFAKSDGFKDWEDLKNFWYKNHGTDCFPYTGTIIAFKKVRSLPKKKSSN